MAQKARTDMQTKLRMYIPALVAGLLWTSALAAAPTATAPKTAKRPFTNVYGGKTKYVGVASWYGKPDQGHKMANGQPFDRRKMTAAAWNIPLGTTVHVINVKNGNSVDVIVTDRGPHPRLSRAIDLSEAAATQLGYIDTGLTSVYIIPLPKGQFESAQIKAQLIEPVELEDAPVHFFFDAQQAQPTVMSAALVPDSMDQSR
jgi:rare lipoprotein A